MVFLIRTLGNIHRYMALWIELLPFVTDLDAHIRMHNEAVKMMRYVTSQYFLTVSFACYTVIRFRRASAFSVQMACAGIVIFFLAFVESGIFRGSPNWFIGLICAPALGAGFILIVSLSSGYFLLFCCKG